MLSNLFRRNAIAIGVTLVGLAALAPVQAAVIGSPGSDFYNLPSPLPAGAHGDLVSYRVATVKLDGATPDANAWNVSYLTQDAAGKPRIATGTVLVPRAAAAGERQVILYAPGVHGLGNNCAPSRQFEIDGEYEAANITAALKAGYAVLVTDYVGYTNGQVPRFMAGVSQGRNLLDIFKAATGIPGVGFTASAKAAIWGYSQGGQAAAFAAEQHPTYAPNVSLVAVAQGGTPGDLYATADYLNGRNGAAFLFSAMLGLKEEYPLSVPLDLVLSPDKGKPAFEALKSKCIFRALYDYQNDDISEYTNEAAPLDILLSLPGVIEVMDKQAVGATKVNVPMYQYHGQADQFIPLAQAVAVKKAYCAKGTDVTFALYPGEHIITQFQAAPTVLSWLGDRFASKPTQGTCNSNAPDPVSTANDNTGNIKVSLVKWPLAAKVDLKTLKQTVILPATSTFSEETDINDKTLTGVLSVPEFKQSLKLLGIGAQIAMKIVPSAPASGSVELSDVGRLTVKGNVPVDITITSVWGIPFGQCKTEKPVNFPLNFEGPISSLGNGNLTFSGTTSFPMIKGCIISAIISAFMTGNGQAYTFTVSPPAPKPL